MKTGWRIGVTAGACLALLSGVVFVLIDFENFEKGGWGVGLGLIAMSTLVAGLVCGLIGARLGWLIGLVGGKPMPNEPRSMKDGGSK